MILKLSDMYTVLEEEYALDLQVIMLNINPGHNARLLNACKTLRDYSEYTHRVRTYAEDMPLEDAVERAITECIRDDILAEFLRKYRAEAKSVSIYEYDEEKHMRFVREEGLEQGLVRKLIEMVVKKLRRNKTPEMIAEELEEPIEQIAAICEAARPYAPDYDCQSIYQALVGEKR